MFFQVSFTSVLGHKTHKLTMLSSRRARASRAACATTACIVLPQALCLQKTPVFRQQSPRFRPLPGDLWCGSARKEGGGHPEASHSADPHLVSACTDHAAHRVQAPPRSSWPPAQVQLRAAHAVVRSAAAHQQDFQELLESRPPVDMVPAAELKQLLDFGRSHDTKSRRHVDQCCAKKKGERAYT